MCWITLAPKQKHRHRHHLVDNDCKEERKQDSSIEYLVRRDRVSLEDSSHHHHSDVHILTPVEVDLGHHHHHHHHPHLHPHLSHRNHHHQHHLHPLNLHPIKLHGHGRKRTLLPTPPPPPSRCPSQHRDHDRSRSQRREADQLYHIQPIDTSRAPSYRTTIVEPAVQEIRETTRIALREARPRRSKGLRRVAGYEVLNRQVPWSWDCVSSVADSGNGAAYHEIGRGRRDTSSLRYPPFGSATSWM